MGTIINNPKTAPETSSGPMGQLKDRYLIQKKDVTNEFQTNAKIRLCILAETESLQLKAEFQTLESFFFN